ncbi:MAG: hypothetical protein IT561_01340 [Alphaproteobacteria bacterium]|nr:hypothetical protein [Alphaproteobacteria bacterium]
MSRLHAPGRSPGGPTQGSPPPAKRRILVPVNDNRPPLPVRLRRPLIVAACLAAVLAAAARWLL